MDEIIKHKVVCLNSHLSNDILYQVYFSLQVIYKTQLTINVSNNYKDTVHLLKYIYLHKNNDETVLEYLLKNHL